MFALENTVGVEPVEVALEGRFVCSVDWDVSAPSNSPGIVGQRSFEKV
jgi:hypothetical protein